MVNIKGIDFEVKINRRNIRNLRMSLKGNKLIIAAPMLMPEYEIYQYINTKRSWIYKAYEFQMYRNRHTTRYDGGDIFYVFDEPYAIVRSDGKKKISVDKNDRKIYFSYPSDSDDDGTKYLYKYFSSYVLKEAEVFLNRYLFFLEDHGYHQVPELKCRLMKTLWGECYSSRNMILLNSMLINFPLDCLEYVMVHEMTHFIVMNHSERFYGLVGSVLPEYKKAVERLKL